ncbi:MurR/RpiR family transcriptional regulator [Ostreiculturibacter nitratireducens]|uniref:MurR/RpiR family transcriptional regulator n=1 Tax=Ostreiculturibacter nitratireducens TaxID=3075226 RepID=UPI0031B571E7
MPESQDNLRDRLGRIAAEGTPTVSAFAAWVLDNFTDVAFLSIRRLAERAGVNANTVMRLSRELGYDGFDAFRAEVQSVLQQRAASYGERAQALFNRSGPEIFGEVITASRANAEAVFSAEGLEQLESCIAPLLSARRVYAVGVRSCYSIAHYFSYVGNMAFPNFVEVASLPGSILDQVSRSGPEDIVVAITYEHYSTEVVRACQVARDCGARILAMTDSHSSPIAAGAWKVLRLPMAGPQLMPSLASAFTVVEMLLAGMAARSETAAENIAAFERRISSFGGYLRS